MDNHSLEICFSDTAILLKQEKQQVDPWYIFPLNSPSKVIKVLVSTYWVNVTSIVTVFLYRAKV